jgi:glycosyltransferase involved in cell wall biosynthesis
MTLVSYQGIALAMPQASRDRTPLQGLDVGHRPHPAAARKEAFVSQRYNSEKLMDSSHPAAVREFPNPEAAIPDVPILDVSIIVPARNEEANIGDCLRSLTSQTGVTFEIIVVDDASTDRTREIAQSFAGVRVISPKPPRDNWTGKNNALVAGTKEAHAGWLLFTDADTLHLPHSLKGAFTEAKREQAALLSYSPEQVVVTFAERAVMPVIFAELAAQYPPDKVRDQTSDVIAANGQYILVRREAYDAVGGHAAVATEILEDVALAQQFRNAGKRIYFRYGGDAVRTRMYRTWEQLREGWTKNLALLFPHPERLALWSLSQWFIAWSSLGIAAWAAASQHFVWIAIAAFWLLAYRRIRTAHFATANSLIAMAFGPPMFAYLLLRSKRVQATGQVSWKGRSYDVGAPGKSAPAGSQTATPILRTGN